MAKVVAESPMDEMRGRMSLQYDEIFDDLLMGKCHNIVNVSNIVAHINMKLLQSLEDDREREIYSDLLNDIKLLSAPVTTEH